MCNEWKRLEIPFLSLSAFPQGPIVRYDLPLLTEETPTQGNVHLRGAPPLVSTLIVAVAKRESSSKWKILMFNQLLMSEILLLHEFFSRELFPCCCCFLSTFFALLLRLRKHPKSSSKEAEIKTDIPKTL